MLRSGVTAGCDSCCMERHRPDRKKRYVEATEQTEEEFDELIDLRFRQQQGLDCLHD